MKISGDKIIEQLDAAKEAAKRPPLPVATIVDGVIVHSDVAPDEKALKLIKGVIQATRQKLSDEHAETLRENDRLHRAIARFTGDA